MDAAGWEAGVDGASSNILVETKIPYSAFGGSLPPQMRLAFVMTSGTLSSAVLQTNDGRPVVYPPAVGRRRAVPAPGSAAASRTIILDGLGGDWIGIAPLLSGGASSGSQNGIVNITSDINLVNDSSQMNVTLTNNTFSDPHDADKIWR